MTVYEIPFTQVPVRFPITIVGSDYKLAVSWCDAAQCWNLEIADRDGNLILSSVPVVTGCNLLEQFDYLDFGFALFAQTDNDPDVPPTFSTLGSTGHLYVATP